jgi:hypothetical protein
VAVVSFLQDIVIERYHKHRASAAFAFPELLHGINARGRLSGSLTAISIHTPVRVSCGPCGDESLNMKTNHPIVQR